MSHTQLIITAKFTAAGDDTLQQVSTKLTELSNGLWDCYEQLQKNDDEASELEIINDTLANWASL